MIHVTCIGLDNSVQDIEYKITHNSTYLAPDRVTWAKVEGPRVRVAWAKNNSALNLAIKKMFYIHGVNNLCGKVYWRMM